jgi:hexosaminidase
MSLSPNVDAVAAGEFSETGVVPLPSSVYWRCTLGLKAELSAISSQTKLLFVPGVKGASEAAADLAEKLARDGGPKLTPAEAPEGKTHADIDEILFVSAEGLKKEGYRLHAAAGVTMEAGDPAGHFYAVQTLLQLLNPTGEKGALKPLRAGLHITDEPRFAWRGMMLDCCRHFFTVDEVKEVIDMMASLKLNVFHWHLTEDQAWRIEIKKYPELTEKGAWREGVGFGLPTTSTTHYRASDGQYGGFYTQDDVRDVIAYAAARHITVVPEIEMPGHATAALTVYPKLGCTGGPYEMMQKGGVFKEVYCAGNDETIAFLKDVLDEVSELFPSQFIHVGGDECPKDRWTSCSKCQGRIKAEGLKDEHELQSWVMRTMEKHLSAKGKRLLGWDEILEGGLPPGATVMSWRGMKGGIAAADSGHDVVMSPTTHCYFDYYQSEDKDREPKAIGGFLPLEKVYELDPVTTAIAENKRHHVLGAQANLWTEYIPNAGQMQYMIAPRIAALAEVVWTPQEKRDWPDFRMRLAAQLKRFEARGFNYRKPE